MSKKQLEKIDVVCEICKQSRTIARGSHQQVVKRNGFYRCATCSPQRNKAFWQDDEKKIAHSKVMKSSSVYYNAISQRDVSGEKNGMFGKKHAPRTIEKMSKSRTGKIGKNATAWKGGKTSLTKRVKGLIQTRYGWFTKVFVRDNYTCTQCKSQDLLDAHHIDPIVKIISRITKGQSFQDDNSKTEYIINHPDIEDKELKNGTTLCRACHKKAHQNWGSHVRP